MEAIAAEDRPPSLSECLAFIDPYSDHKLYAVAQETIMVTFLDEGPWEAAARASEMADAYADIYFLQGERKQRVA